MTAPAGLVLGVDAGGTKTDAALADANTGELIASVRVGPGNHERVGWAGSADALRLALDTVCSAAGATVGVVTAGAWGLAGLDWPADAERYREIIDSFELAGPQLVVNDAFLALEQAPPGAAIAVVAGTGMVAVARDATGRTARTLGVGAGHGEWGSGGDVVRAAAEGVAGAHLGFGPPTDLTAAALAASGATDASDYCRLVWREHRPALTPADVWDVAAGGDAMAASIAARAADSYAAAAASLVRRLHLEPTPTVLLTGRVLDPGHDLLHTAIEAAFAARLPGTTVRRLGVAPVLAAVRAASRIAAQRGGSPGIRHRSC